MASFGQAAGSSGSFGQSAPGAVAAYDASTPVAPADPLELKTNQGQKAFAELIARGQFSKDPTDNQQAKDLLARYGSGIEPAFFKAAGVKGAPTTAPQGWNESANSKGGFFGPAANAIGVVGNVLGRAQQTAYAGARFAGVALARGIHNTTGLGNEPATQNSGLAEIGQAIAGHGAENLYDVVGRAHDSSIAGKFTAGLDRLGIPHPSWAGQVANAGFNAAGAISTDPLLITGGETSTAKAARGILEGAGMGEQATTAARSGFSSLAPDVQAQMHAAISGSENVKNIAAAARPGIFGGVTTPADVAAKLSDAYARGAQSGVRFGGTTFLPRETVSNAMNLIPGVQGTLRPAVGGAISALGEKLAPAFSNTARIAREIGPEGAKAFQNLSREGAAAGNAVVPDIVLQNASFHDLSVADQGLVRQALEGGTAKAAEIEAGLSPEAKAALKSMQSQRDEIAAKLTAQVPTSQGTMQLAEPNSALAPIQQNAEAAAKARLLAEAQAPIPAAQATAQKVFEAEHARLTAEAQAPLTQAQAALEKVKSAPPSGALPQARADAVKTFKAAHASLTEEARAATAKAEAELATARSEAARLQEDLAAKKAALPTDRPASSYASRTVGAAEQRARAAGSRVTAAENALTQSRDPSALNKALSTEADKATASIEKATAKDAADQAKALKVATGAVTKAQAGADKGLAAAEEAARKVSQPDLDKALATAAKKTAAAPDAALAEGVLARNKAAAAGTYLKAPDTWMHHQFTDEGRAGYQELTKSNPKLAAQMHSDMSALSAGHSLESRVMQGSAESVQEQWAKAFDQAGIAHSGNLIEMNPVTAMAHSGVQAQRAVSELHILAGLADVPNEAGTGMLIIHGEGAAERAAALGYEQIPGSIVKDTYAHPKTIELLKGVQAVTHNDEDLKKFSDLFKSFDRHWSSGATVASTPKRYVGHIFQGFLAGVKDPTAYLDAERIQQADRLARNFTGRAVGPAWEDALKTVGKLSDKDVEAYLAARKAGIAATGYMPQNLASSLDKQMGTEEPKTGLMGALTNNQRFHPMERMRDVNLAMDNNVRLGHYLGVYANTGSYDSAAESVYKHLFDYSDLTPIEQRFKQYARFYTYLRKNTPLQVLGMLEHPGVYSTRFNLARGLAQAMPAAPGPYAKYALDAGGVPTSTGILGMDMPFEHAIKALTPVAQAAALIPGVQNFLPKGLRPEGGANEVIRNVLQNAAGGPMSVVKAAAEQATGHSLQTGGPIQAEPGKRWMQILNQLAPLTTHVNPLLDAKGGNPLTQIGLNLANIKDTPISDQTRKSEIKREQSVAQGAIKNAPPTVSELRQAGMVPDAKQAAKILKDAMLVMANPKAKLTKAQKVAAALLHIKVPAA